MREQICEHNASTYLKIGEYFREVPHLPVNARPHPLQEWVPFPIMWGGGLFLVVGIGRELNGIFVRSV